MSDIVKHGVMAGDHWAIGDYDWVVVKVEDHCPHIRKNMEYWTPSHPLPSNHPDWDTAVLLHRPAVATAEPTIEERRAQLKPGDVVKDPALLCKGMRIAYREWQRTLVKPTDIGGRIQFWNNEGTYIGSEYVRTTGVTFLGWASEEGEAKRCEKMDFAGKRQCEVRGPHSLHVFDATKPIEAPKPEPPKAQHDFSDRYCVAVEQTDAGKELVPRCKNCGRREDRCDPEVECAPWDWRATVAATEAHSALPAQRDPKPEKTRIEHSVSGLGGTVGPVLSRLR